MRIAIKNNKEYENDILMKETVMVYVYGNYVTNGEEYLKDISSFTKEEYESFKNQIIEEYENNKH